MKGRLKTASCSAGSGLARRQVKNCVLMQDTVVEAGAEMEYVVTDKDVTITAGKRLKGADTFPVYVAKYMRV